MSKDQVSFTILLEASAEGIHFLANNEAEIQKMNRELAFSMREYSGISLVCQ